MATDNPTRVSMFEDLLRRTASGVRNAQLYAPDHPLVARNMAGLVAVLTLLHQHQPSIAVGIVGNDLVVADTPMHKLSGTMTELIRKLKDNKVERIAFERGVTQEELVALVQNLSRLGGKAAGDADKDLSSAHIRVGRLKSGENKKQDGIASDIAAIRQMYSSAVASAEVLVESAETEGMPDAPAALQTVEGLADAVTQNRTALMALTAMRSYDNYTFTHMVNVSILAMAQARALGIDGKLLREFGMSALMHDIGKVRTPKAILNKPEKLTDEEFVIMRRHVVDGAEILRRTPEMPILAPVVAFEHHLRLDGSGYPLTVKRESMNLGSMLCDRRRVRRDAVAADVPAGLSDRSDPRGPETQRGIPARSAPRAPVRTAPRHLPAGHAGAPQHGRNRRRSTCPRPRSAPPAGPRALLRRRLPPGAAFRAESVGNPARPWRPGPAGDCHLAGRSGRLQPGSPHLPRELGAIQMPNAE
jgi:putative nucleotidyltransferase with HDIG domain